MPQHISAADAELVIKSAQHINSGTEACANVHAALKALQNGSRELAANQLGNHSHAIRRGVDGTPGPDMQTAVTHESCVRHIGR